MKNKRRILDMLERREVITLDPDEASLCCGLPRDEDGFCSYKSWHPVYVGPKAGGPTREDGTWYG